MRTKRIMYFIIIESAIVVITVVCQSHWGQPRYEGPEISLLEGNTYDFGEIDEGKEVKHRYIFQNSGTRYLKIYQVNASCGCINAKADKNEIAPGGKGEIEVLYRARQVNYRDTIVVYVKTNQSRSPYVKLTLTGIIRRRVFWYPQAVSFYGMHGQTDMIRKIAFSASEKSSSPLELEVASVSSKNIVAKSVKDKEKAVIEITLLPMYRQGSYIENVTIKCTRNEFTKLVDIPIYVMLR